MKKTLLSIAVFVSVLIPSVTFASWYNPLSWFRKAPVSVVVPVVQPIQATADIVAPVALPVSKPVITNTITVEDPKLQSQINDLAKSDTDLQVQLASLTAKYNILVAQNTSLSTQVASLTSENTSLKAQATAVTQAVPQVPQKTQCEIDRDAKIKDLTMQIINTKNTYYSIINEIKTRAEPLEDMNGQISNETNQGNLAISKLQNQIDQAKLSCS